jgi:hypothetical protein
LLYCSLRWTYSNQKKIISKEKKEKKSFNLDPYQRGLRQLRGFFGFCRERGVSVMEKYQDLAKSDSSPARVHELLVDLQSEIKGNLKRSSELGKTGICDLSFLPFLFSSSPLLTCLHRSRKALVGAHQGKCNNGCCQTHRQVQLILQGFGFFFVPFVLKKNKKKVSGAVWGRLERST